MKGISSWFGQCYLPVLCNAFLQKAALFLCISDFGDSLARPIRALALPGNKGFLLKSLTIRLCDNKAVTVLDSERDSGPEFLKFLCHSPSNGDNGVTILIV